MLATQAAAETVEDPLVEYPPAAVGVLMPSETVAERLATVMAVDLLLSGEIAVDLLPEMEVQYVQP